MPWSHHFQRLVNKDLMHHPPPVSFPRHLILGNPDFHLIVQSQPIPGHRMGSRCTADRLLHDPVLLRPDNRLVVIIPLLVIQGKLQIEPGIAIDTGRPLSVGKGQRFELVGDGKLLAILYPSARPYFLGQTLANEALVTSYPLTQPYGSPAPAPDYPGQQRIALRIFRPAVDCRI